MKYFTPIETYRTKYYQKAVSYKHFDGLTEDRMTEIKEILAKYNERRSEKQNTNVNHMSQIDYYIELLQYLTNPQIHFTFKTFDEKMYFMIQALDPEFEMQKMYLSSEILSNKEIIKIKNRLRMKSVFFYFHSINLIFSLFLS